MTEQLGKTKVKQFYNDIARAVPGFSLMNYGYATEPGQRCTHQEPEVYCLQLYAHVVRGINLEGMTVLEVGCGRGGGANYIKQAYRPHSLNGVDLSDKNIELARERFGQVEGLDFSTGDAENLPFLEGYFDAVLNIESSHLYDNCHQFFAEVYRVLKPGGFFFFAGLFENYFCYRNMLIEAGFAFLAEEDITCNILKALDNDSERRERIIDANLKPELRDAFKHWAGVRGYKVYELFSKNVWLYYSCQLKRS